MNTTFILHGGVTKVDNPDNDLFFKSFTQYVKKDEVHILICYFAKGKNIWDERLKLEKSFIEKQTNKKISLTLAYDAKDLLDKLTTHDVLYIAGGEAELIEPYLSSLTQLKDLLKGKIYIGSSMGAFIASSFYVLSFDDQDEKSAHKGLELLPINTLCHWNREKNKQEKITLLKNASADLPILTLEEYKMATFIY